MVFDLKKLENIEKPGTRVNKCKFAKDSSIRARMRGKIIGNRYLR